MKETRWIMGMPITVCLANKSEGEKTKKAVGEVFDYFTYVDKIFSTYKKESEISRINRKEIGEGDYSEDMKTVFELSKKTQMETNGYFNILTPEGLYDPSGLVKGWSIYNAADILSELGYKNFYVDAGGDIEARGKNEKGEAWGIGIRDPFSKDANQIVKTVFITGCGMATSGTYIRGQHIYNPHIGRAPLRDIISITVIGPNVYEADRFATAAFAMGVEGINFIEGLPGFEGYSIDSKGMATETSGFEKFTKKDENDR